MFIIQFVTCISVTDGYDSQHNNVTNVLLLYTRINVINTGLKVNLLCMATLKSQS